MRKERVSTRRRTCRRTRADDDDDDDDDDDEPVAVFGYPMVFLTISNISKGGIFCPVMNEKRVRVHSSMIAPRYLWIDACLLFFFM